MPDRVIRDELDKSERYWQLGAGPDGEVTDYGDFLRLLFRHLLNMADDYGNAEAGPIALGSTMNRAVSAAQANKWRADLSTVDLVRPYQVGIKWFVHIPRFRQRLRALRGRHPRPPPDVECSEIKELISSFVRQTPDTRPSDAGQVTDTRQTDAGQTPDTRPLARARGIESNRIDLESNRNEVQQRELETARATETPETAKPVYIIPEPEIKTPRERALELAEKLKKPPSGEPPRSRDEQLAYVARQAKK